MMALLVTPGFINGMQAHLQTIHDVIDHVEGCTEDIFGLRQTLPLAPSRKLAKAVNV